MIDKTQLGNDIKDILNNLKNYEGNQQDAINSFSEQLAEKIADAIKRGIDTTVVTFALTAGTTPVSGTINLQANE